MAPAGGFVSPGTGIAVGRVCPRRSDVEDLVEAGGPEGCRHVARRRVEHELAAVLLHALQRINKDREPSGVDEGRRPEVNDEPTVALAVDDIDEPVLEFVGVVRVERTVDVDDHLAKGTTEPKGELGPDACDEGTPLTVETPSLPTQTGTARLARRVLRQPYVGFGLRALLPVWDR